MAARRENVLALELLGRVDGALFREAEAWLAGDAAVSLRCGEFRIAREVSFLCASCEGYRALRERAGERGGRGLFAREVVVVSEARVDQYGVRMAVDVEGVTLRFEVVREERVVLTGVLDAALPVARLCDRDLVAVKLLANDDRYRDDGALGRDAIDLIVLEETLGALPAGAWEKARRAYGPSVARSWAQSLRRMRDRPAWLARDLDALGVTPAARASVVAKLSKLDDLGEVAASHARHANFGG